MNRLKFFATLVAAAMTLTLAAGCSDGGTDTAVTEAAGETVVAASESASHKLCNPNASAAAQEVYDYLWSVYGTNMISCQQESTWMGSPDYEMDYIKATTGKLPAMRGLDYMNADFDGVNQRAIEWWQGGGLVTICWHTGINGKGYQESKDDVPDFDKLLTEGTEEYNNMMANWDKAANALAELRNQGVVVLWRPFHEFDGQWFWWGKGGAENFIALWKLMYDKFTNEYGLNNLIWVLGYADNVTDGWYVGDDYCDVIGSDTYKGTTTHKSAWDKLQNVSSEKLLTFHECGNIPSAEDFQNDGCIWSWFMIWHTDYITGNDKNNLANVYNSELVITLDELPEFGG